jgi:glycerol kinase
MAAPLSTTIALDLGTTSIKAGLLDDNGELARIISRPAPEITVNGGQYESDALAYLATANLLLQECVAYADSHPSLGLCCQRSSFLIWDQTSGTPVTRLISWQDNRGAISCAALQAEEAIIRKLTGLRLAPYYFAPKVRLLLQEHPEWRAGLEQGDLLIGTLDSFLIWRWSDGRYHQTDVSMAARTLLMDIRSRQWSQTLCDLFDIPLPILPKILPSSDLNLPLNNGCILQSSVADQSAALIAGVGMNRSDALVNLGTGGFVICYVPEQQSAATDGYLQTLVYQDSSRKTHIAAEGTLNSIAVALAPYPFKKCRIENLAASDTIFCIAEPSGIGAPYFRDIPGIVFSKPVEHLTKHQVACLLLEAIIFRVTRILHDFQRLYGINRIYLSGGLAELPVLQQGIALCSGLEVYRLQQKDSSLQGAAILAAGLPAANNAQAFKVQIPGNSGVLRDKYEHWKIWFDTFLNT